MNEHEIQKISDKALTSQLRKGCKLSLQDFCAEYSTTVVFTNAFGQVEEVKIETGTTLPFSLHLQGNCAGESDPELADNKWTWDGNESVSDWAGNDVVKIVAYGESR